MATCKPGICYVKWQRYPVWDPETRILQIRVTAKIKPDHEATHEVYKVALSARHGKGRPYKIYAKTQVNPHRSDVQTLNCELAVVIPISLKQKRIKIEAIITARTKGTNKDCLHPECKEFVDHRAKRWMSC